MQAYRQRLTDAGAKVWYVNSYDPENDLRLLVPALFQKGYRVIHMADPVDDWITKRTRISAEASGMALIIHPGPGFLNTQSELQVYARGKKGYFQTDFYIAQRKKRKILLDPDGKPAGGQWTYDAENRKKFPKHGIAPSITFPRPDKY
jgi:deoxyribodipyrimidine photolyase-related protein